MTYDNLLTALADPTRRRVLEVIARAPSPVGRIAAQLPVSRPAVSQHLKVLSDAGLVAVQVKGTRRIYSLQPKALNDLRRYLDDLWDTALNNFANEVKKQKGIQHD